MRRLIVLSQGTLKGKYHFTVDLLFDWFGILCITTDNFRFYLQNILIQTGQTVGHLCSDTYHFSVPWLSLPVQKGFSELSVVIVDVIMLSVMAPFFAFICCSVRSKINTRSASAIYRLGRARLFNFKLGFFAKENKWRRIMHAGASRVDISSQRLYHHTLYGLPLQWSLLAGLHSGRLRPYSKM